MCPACSFWDTATASSRSSTPAPAPQLRALVARRCTLAGAISQLRTNLRLWSLMLFSSSARQRGPALFHDVPDRPNSAVMTLERNCQVFGWSDGRALHETRLVGVEAFAPMHDARVVP